MHIMDKMFNLKKSAILIVVALFFFQVNGNTRNIKIVDLIDIEGFEFYVDSVIVVQDEQFTIGHRMRHDELEPFKLPYGRIDRTLQELFQQSFPYEAGKRKLILKVNRIIFNTFNQNSEFGANITFIEVVDGNFIELVTIRSSWVNESTLSSSSSKKSRGENLVKSLEFFLMEFVEELSTKDNNAKILSEEDLTKPIAINAQNFPVLSGSLNADTGVVVSFDDFLNVHITKDASLTLEPKALDKSPYQHVKVASNNHSSEEIWGVFDGTHFYIKENEAFGQLFVKDNRFILHAPSTSQGKVDRKGLLVVVGVMTASVVALNTVFPFGQALLISMPIGFLVDLVTSRIINKRKAYVYYELDLLTGLVSQIDKWWNED